MKYTVSDCFGTWLFEDGSNSVNGGGCLLFRCEQLSIRFLNPFLLPGFPGISHLIFFGPKLMNENLSIDCYR